MTVSKRLLAPAFTWLAVAAGCAHNEDGRSPPDAPVSSVADLHKITVTTDERAVEAPLSEVTDTVGAATRAALAQLLQNYAADGHGPVSVSAPQGLLDEAELVARTETLVATLASLGIPRSVIATSRHDASDAGQKGFIVSYMQYRAIAPDCAPIWTQNLAYAPDNQPWESFGCAAQANLAAMIADPRDLERPRAETPADAFRRQTVLDKYRAGETTHSARSADERAVVSGVLQ